MKVKRAPIPTTDVISIYLDPETYTYLGISRTVSQKGKKLVDERGTYTLFEYTDGAPSMNTEGMREVKGYWSSESDAGYWLGDPDNPGPGAVTESVP